MRILFCVEMSHSITVFLSSYISMSQGHFIEVKLEPYCKFFVFKCVCVCVCERERERERA